MRPSGQAEASAKTAAETGRPDPEVVELRAEVARLRDRLARAGAEEGRAAPGGARAEARHRDALAATQGAADGAAGERAAGAAPRGRHDALALNEARQAAILESAADFAIITADLRGRITSWSKGAENVLGWREDEALGRPAHMIFTPEDRVARAPEAEMATALRDGRAEDVRWHLRRDGARFWGSGLMMPLRDADGAGEPRGFLKILRDRTAEKRAQDELREKAEFLERVLESSGDCIKVLGLDGRLEFMSAGGRTVMEVDDFGAVAGAFWPDLWEGEGGAAARAALDAARAGGTGRFQGHARTAKGTPKDWDVVVTPILGADGRPERLLSISRDVTDLKRAADALREGEARARLLAGELHHRVKNTLAMAGAIAAQTLRGAATPAEAREAIDARLQALGRAHDLLARDGWAAADLRGVVADALKPHDDGVPGRFRLDGPPVALSAQAAAAIALAMHELATNAAKHGALTAPGGRVAIDWALLEGGAGGERLRLRWQERGGPPVAPPARRGFGSRLIERGLFGPGARVRLDFGPAGASCEIEAPAASLRDGPQP